MNRILIVRLSAIGDVVMSTAIIPALKTRYPKVEVDWLVGPVSDAILEANPNLFQVMTLPSSRWKRLWKEKRWIMLLRDMWALKRQLRSRNYDCVIDLQGLAKSGFWAFMSGAERRIGLRSKEGSQFWMGETLYPKLLPDGAVSYQYEAVARYLGYKGDSFFMDLYAGEVGDQLASAFRIKSGLSGTYAVVAPFTTRPQKHWFTDYWVDLIHGLIDELKLQVLVIGGPGDVGGVSELKKAVGRKELVSVCGKEADLRRSVALIGEASLFVGVDTGLTHVAFGVRVPTVALFGSTHPYWESRYNEGVVLHDRLECSPCDRSPTCQGQFSCMRGITVDRVMRAAKQVMATADSRTACDLD